MLPPIACTIRKHTDWVCLLLLSGLCFSFFLPFFNTAAGEVVWGVDLLRLFKPMYAFGFAAFRAGRLPLWNPYLFLGFPQYAEPQTSTFYPPMWLAAWLSFNTAVTLLYSLHFAIAATGGYLLVRQWGGRWSGALLGGCVLAFNAFMTYRIFAGHISLIMSIAYVPWSLLAAGWAVEKRTWSAAVVAGLPLGVAILVGHAPLFPFFAAAVSFLMLYLAWNRGRAQGRAAALKVLGQWGLLGAFAALLGAIQLLPTLQFARLSSRPAVADYAFANAGRLDFVDLLRLLMPDLYGGPVTNAPYWQPDPSFFYWEQALYVGILPLLLTGLALVHARRPWLPWFVIGGGGLLLALGSNAVLHRLFYLLIPGFGYFRIASRYGYFLILAVAVLAGLTFDRWLALPAGVRRRQTRWLFRAVGYTTLVLGGLVLWLTGRQIMQPEALKTLQHVSDQIVRLGLLSAAAVGTLALSRRLAAWQVTAVALALLLVDLWGVGWPQLLQVSAAPEAAWQVADAELPAARTDYRIFTGRTNAGYRHGFLAIGGYDDALNAQTWFDLEAEAGRNPEIARLLSGRYWVTDPDNTGPETQGWTLRVRTDDVAIYELPGPLPRAFVVHEVVAAADAETAREMITRPEIDLSQTAVVQTAGSLACPLESAAPAKGHVEMIAYRPQRVVLDVSTGATGWLVLNDLYYPGWEATLDGERVPLYPTNYGLRGLCVPAGSHTVTFTFRPAVLRYGAALSGVALLMLAGALFALWRPRAPK